MLTVKKNLSFEKGVALFFLVVVVIACFYFVIDGKSQAVLIFDYLERLGAWAPFLFIVIDMLAVVFVVPGVIFTLGAGFMFGILKGTLYVVVGSTLGSAIAFTIARYLFGERAAGFVLAHTKLKLVADAFKLDGLKIVLFTHLIPFFPFKLSNYFFGLMPVSLRSFVLGVFFGIVPFTVINVYIGSLIADIATLGSRSIPRSRADWAIYAFGFIITICVVIYFVHVARRVMQSYNLELKGNHMEVVK